MDFVGAMGDRSPWEGEARLLDGRLVTCRFRPLTGGATMISFRLQGAEPVFARPELVSARLLSA